MVLPLVNAKLTRVEGEPLSDEYGVPIPGSGTLRWTGSAKAYVSDTMRYATSGDRLDLVRDSRIKLDLEPAGRLVEEGDMLDYTRDGESFTRKARDVSSATLFGRVDIWLVSE